MRVVLDLNSVAGYRTFLKVKSLPVHSFVGREAWFDIKETDTLNGQKGLKRARGANDIKHICPLQLQVIERLVRMYSNPGEVVFSPFAGIGSEGAVAIRLGRRFYGCELKPEYQSAVAENLDAAVAAIEASKAASDLFAAVAVEG